jgi:mannose-6-phosphate isomerase-like protein (cupin superfamily)/quercetin dioxygenase-like cupin family protein
MITETGIVDEIARRDPDVVSSGGSRTWSLRARNVVVAITEIAADDRITEHDVPDEHVLLVPDGAAVTVQRDGDAPVQVGEPALVVVPAGTSVVRATAAATVVRVFTTRCAEQVLRAVNHAAPVDRRAAPLPEPAETGGDGVRVHRLRDVPDTPGRLGRIFRTTSLMVNWFPVQVGPRDTEQLSPHAHEDAEQMSVTLAGRYVHHLRVPWTPRMSEWRDDRAVEVASPSMTVIAPTVVHTSRAVGTGPHVLVDVFAPPRADFLARGWVLNADEYRARPS